MHKLSAMSLSLVSSYFGILVNGELVISDVFLDVAGVYNTLFICRSQTVKFGLKSGKCSSFFSKPQLPKKQDEMKTDNIKETVELSSVENRPMESQCKFFG